MPDHDRLPPPTTDHWDWQLRAACRGADVTAFYHPSQERSRSRERRIERAKAVCAQCPVLSACRRHALSTREPYGVWGGLSEDERAGILGVRSLQYPGPAQRPVHLGPAAAGDCPVADGAVRA
jgi:WhiB family redox-sensing transcriptional regulator